MLTTEIRCVQANCSGRAGKQAAFSISPNVEITWNKAKVWRIFYANLVFLWSLVDSSSSEGGLTLLMSLGWIFLHVFIFISRLYNLICIELTTTKWDFEECRNNCHITEDNWRDFQSTESKHNKNCSCEIIRGWSGRREGSALIIWAVGVCVWVK